MVFGLFKKKPKHVDEPDEIYTTRARADAALVNAAVAATRPVVVASFFPESLDRAQRLLTAAGVSTQALDTSASIPALGTVLLLDASQVVSNFGFDGWLLRADCECSFLFVEHHPLQRTEQAVIDVLDQASTRKPQRVRFFVGLDEPFMKVFSGDKIVSLMERMGMPPDEAITHSLVDKSISNAQAKLQKRVPNAVPARSAEEWFRVNVESAQR